MDVGQIRALYAGEEGAVQDATHEIMASVRTNDHKYVVTPSGRIYKIGPEPEPITVTTGHLWWKKTEQKQSCNKFGLGFGGQLWTVFFNDGTTIDTHNLWSAGDAADFDFASNVRSNGTIQQGPFWGSNLGIKNPFGKDYLEHLLQPPPQGSVYEHDIYCVHDVRASFTEREDKERSRFIPLIRNRYGRFYVEIYAGRLVRFVRGLVNRVVCTNCWHLASKHWEATAQIAPGEYETYDWGCGVDDCDC